MRQEDSNIRTLRSIFLTMYKLDVEYNLQHSAFPYWHQEAGVAAKCTEVKSKLLHD
jgi:arabinogalactan endo-1,4-beta-galactosidase